MENPAEEVSTLDWRVKTAAKIWKTRTGSVEGLTDFINCVIKMTPPRNQPLATRGTISRMHGRLSEPANCSFSQFMTLRVNQPYPVGLHGYLAGAPVPDSLDAVRGDREVLTPVSPLTMLATPFRQKNDVRWAQRDSKAVFFHTEGSSCYVSILGQAFRLYDQLERTRPGLRDDDVSVSIIPSYTFILATNKGAKSPVIPWDWRKMWRQVVISKRASGAYPKKDDWELKLLNPIAAYWAKALQVSWDARILPSPLRGMELSKVFDEQWKVWAPYFPRKLPLWHSAQLAARYNKKIHKPPLWKSWPVRPKSNGWLVDETPMGDLLPTIFTPTTTAWVTCRKSTDRSLPVMLPPPIGTQQPPIYLDQNWDNIYPENQHWDRNRGRVQEVRTNMVNVNIFSKSDKKYVLLQKK